MRGHSDVIASTMKVALECPSHPAQLVAGRDACARMGCEIVSATEAEQPDVAIVSAHTDLLAALPKAFVAAFNPVAFVKTFDEGPVHDMLNEAECLSYRTACYLVTCAHYGAATSRTLVIVEGVKGAEGEDSVPAGPEPSRQFYGVTKYPIAFDRHGRFASMMHPRCITNTWQWDLPPAKTLGEALNARKKRKCDGARKEPPADYESQVLDAWRPHPGLSSEGFIRDQFVRNPRDPEQVFDLFDVANILAFYYPDKAAKLALETGIQPQDLADATPPSLIRAAFKEIAKKII